MVSKYEAVGIVISVVVMAGVLGFIKYGQAPATNTGATTSTTNGAVVVATSTASSTSQDSQTALTNAIVDASSLTGQLTKLIIKDVKVGTGDREIKDGDTVTVNYIGATQKGVVFDSSYKRGTPFTFTVGQGRVIQGWEKGLLGMKVGGQRILIIPADMAYGNRQVGPIPPNSNLVFAVELLKIQ